MRPDVVDIYHGDTVDSFHDMAASGVKGVIAKASQGVTLDSAYKSFEARVKSLETPMLFGAYHFATNRDAIAQATYFLSRISKGTLMVLDCERHTGDQVTVAQSEDFVHEIIRRTSSIPVLYYGEWLLEQEASGGIGARSILRQCPSWIARYGSTCPTPIAGSDLVLWQFTGDGVGPEPHTVPGIKANCDTSQWVGNVADMPEFWRKHSR